MYMKPSLVLLTPCNLSAGDWDMSALPAFQRERQEDQKLMGQHSRFKAGLIDTRPGL